MTKAKPVNPSDIASYRMYRSPAAYYLYDVIACDSKNNPLAVIAVELDFDNAASMVDTLNAAL